MKEDDDRTLVRRCRQGDQAAFGQLVTRYQRPVFNAALRLLREPEEAKDVAQTTFLKAFEHLADYDPRFKFYSWLYRIAVNESLDVLHARKPFEQISAEETDGTPGPESPLEGEQMGERRGALMRISLTSHGDRTGAVHASELPGHGRHPHAAGKDCEITAL